MGADKTTSMFGKAIKIVERVGNLLPHPFFLFCFMAIMTLLVSFAMKGISVTYTAAISGAAGSQQVTDVIKNLITVDYIRKCLIGFVKTYSNFPPLGLIMVMMLSIGFAQDTGMFDSALRKTLMSAPQFLVTFALAVVGVCANIASNAGIVFAATIGAALFASLGRNPILGLLTGYCAVFGAYSANLFVAGTDVLLSGITASAATTIGVSAPTHPMINYYYMFAATFVVAILTTIITEKVLPNFISIKLKNKHSEELSKKISPEQNRGLKWAAIAFVVFILVVLALAIPQNAFLRAPNGDLLPKSPLVSSIVFWLFMMFIVTGTAYGIGAGTIKSSKDIPLLMSNGLRGSLVFFAVSLPAAFFVQFFNDSHIATWLSVQGGTILKSLNLTGAPLAIAFVVLAAFLNLFLTGASEKWMVLAPIFVPMFATLNFSPALTQLCYRIGDSTTNPIAPVSYFIPITLGIIAQYADEEEEKDLGVGTLISMTLPYSMAYLVGLCALLLVFIFFDLPIGPGTSLFLK